MANSFSRGFLRETDGSLTVTTSATGASWRSGFLRDANGALVVTTDAANSFWWNGYVRKVTGELVVTTAPASPVMVHGLIRDGSTGALAVASSAAAGAARGFAVDASGYLTVAGLSPYLFEDKADVDGTSLYSNNAYVMPIWDSTNKRYTRNGTNNSSRFYPNALVAGLSDNHTMACQFKTVTTGGKEVLGWWNNTQGRGLTLYLMPGLGNALADSNGYGPTSAWSGAWTPAANTAYWVTLNRAGTLYTGRVYNGDPDGGGTQLASATYTLDATLASGYYEGAQSLRPIFYLPFAGGTAGSGSGDDWIDNLRVY